MSLIDVKKTNLYLDENLYQRDDATYQRLICHPITKYEIEDSKSVKEINHHYHACINVNNGDIYIDCRRRKIFIKHLGGLFIRPIDTLIRTIWNLTIIGPLSLGFYERSINNQTMNSNSNKKNEKLKEITVKQVFVDTALAFLDGLRTPLYGVAITACHLFAIILAVAPNTLYHTRAWAGQLERSLLRVNHISETFDDKKIALISCFSPLTNLYKIDKVQEERYLKKGDEKKIPEDFEKRLTFWSRNQILFLQNETALCNGFHLEPKDQPYFSPAAVKKPEIIKI